MTKPRLSVVVISYNMAREIPRTMRSLSAHMQQGIAAEDYEVILVDNGSTAPFDEAECRTWIPDLRVVHMPDPTSSPVPAINAGIELARGDLIGVMIDGARLASPGLLAAALTASRLHDRPVIGTIGFHLGPDLQIRSMKTGYNQQVEDALLAKSGWEENGYNLFEISVYAGSSKQGWFALPSEANALFLTRQHWQDLGGYDPAFVSPGGGLANLDIWVRACADPTARLIMLLGEATFHQVHGGVSTNSNAKRALFNAEYERLRGAPYAKPTNTPVYYGNVHKKMLRMIKGQA